MWLSVHSSLNVIKASVLEEELLLKKVERESWGRYQKVTVGCRKKRRCVFRWKEKLEGECRHTNTVCCPNTKCWYCYWLFLRPCLNSACCTDTEHHLTSLSLFSCYDIHLNQNHESFWNILLHFCKILKNYIYNTHNYIFNTQKWLSPLFLGQRHVGPAAPNERGHTL